MIVNPFPIGAVDETVAVPCWVDAISFERNAAITSTHLQFMSCIEHAATDDPCAGISFCLSSSLWLIIR